MEWGGVGGGGRAGRATQGLKGLVHPSIKILISELFSNILFNPNLNMSEKNIKFKSIV
jgi:hypothetical protein